MPESLSDRLKAEAAGFVEALPASIEMPAGAGKTHLLAATARHVVEIGGKVLVITHTNAGVQAVRTRLTRFGITRGVYVTTITSFAYRLARAYPLLGGVIVPSAMVPNDSQAYVRAATCALGSKNLRSVLSASYSHVLVDEYQDCNTEHHSLVLSIKRAVGKIGIFGDPLQAIFGFSEPLPDWNEVLKSFPRYSGIIPEPWRWVNHNEALGAWLFEARKHLAAGTVLPLSGLNYPPGVTFTDTTDNHQGVTTAALAALKHPANETVLIISARHASDGRQIASRLSGRYTVMEEIAGKFMEAELTKLVGVEPVGYASWLFKLTKKCHAKSGILDPTPLGLRYERGRPGSSLLESSAKREPVRIVIEALDQLVANPTLAQLAVAMDEIPNAPGIRLHSHEAWNDVKVAIRGASVQGEDKSILRSELAKARNSLRHVGRRERQRIISRTLLIKGLEYDHVIIANIGNHAEVNDLYVALTRARKTIHILADGKSLSLVESPRRLSQPGTVS